jgi:hypothetical protein
LICGQAANNRQANGLLISLAAVYAIYILPRRVIPWKNIVGIPGV